MVPLSRQGAEHFCSSFSGQQQPHIHLRQIYDTVLSKRKTIQEGDGSYELYRDALLREVDRSFFLGISCYRRALDMFTASSTFWAHVSLYYSGWFAANAILGMFGCWVYGRRKKLRIVIEAALHTPGNQQFNVEKNYSTQYLGSHQIFWDAYYRAMTSVVLWTDPSLHLAVTPISNSNIWPIERRNSINYRTPTAFDLMDHFSANFNKHDFPNSLHGETVTQYQLTRTLLLFASQRAAEFKLNTDVFRQFGSRSEAIKNLIYRTRPSNLATHADENRLTV
jgi:hypothetical protein